MKPDTILFFVDQNKIQSDTALSFFQNCCEDVCTPSGVRTSICLCTDYETVNGTVIETYSILDFSLNRQRPKVLGTFNDLDSAKQFGLECLMNYYYSQLEKGHAMTVFFDTYEDAVVEWSFINDVSVEVATSIQKKQQLINKILDARRVEAEKKRKEEELAKAIIFIDTQKNLSSKINQRIENKKSEILNLLPQKYIENRLSGDKTHNDICNKALCLLGTEYMKYLGWINVLKMVYNKIYK